MSAVQPCFESNEMATANVEFLSAFKTIDEEKDSDEESFHLFLDGDDEIIKSDDKISSSEFEDDAVNKNNVEEKEKVIEPAHIRNEENSCDLQNNGSHEVEIKHVTESNEKSINNPDISEDLFTEEKHDTEVDETSTNKTDIPEDSSTEKKISNITETEENNQEISEEIISRTIENVPIQQNEKNETQTDVSNSEQSSSVATDCTPMDIENDENIKETVSKNKIESTTSGETISLMESEDDILNKHATETNDVEDLDPILEESLLDENYEVNEKEVAEKNTDLSGHKTSVTEETSECPEVESNKVEIEELLCENQESSVNTKQKDKVSSKIMSVIDSNNSQKCDDSSNGSSHSDTEDLLDISMIKDSAQDDADIAEDALQLEQENEDSDGNARSIRMERMESVDDSSNIEVSDEDGKGGYYSESQEASENLQMEYSDSEKDKDLQESEVDKEEIFIKDIEETSNKEIEEISDKEIEETFVKEIEETLAKEIEETLEKETEETLDKEVEETSDKEGEENLDKEIEESLDKEIEENLEKENEEASCEDVSLHINNTAPIENDKLHTDDKVTMKRVLSDNIPETAPKKIKLIEGVKKVNNIADSWDITELQSLISFSKFMTKSHLKQLTRADLEEFCVQKLCEAILHKSELGETNHLLKLQEQTIEVLRKEQTVLTKQIKDLEIVNKKLMHEVKHHSGVKPMVPVKITRSVGLQVRMAQGNDPQVFKRRPSQVTPQKTQTPVQNQVVNNRNVRVAQSNTISRQLLPKSPQKQSTPILTQVLQTRNRTTMKTTPTQTNSPVRQGPKSKATPEKRTRTSGSFIDLTDEDDKRMNAKNQNNLKNVVPQGVRINTVPKTSIPSVLPTVVSSSAPQVMYVVQSNSQIKQGLLTTPAGQQKAVLVNFQPTNGVINSLNTSSVSVIPKPAANVQLKTTSALVKMNKHPAPLPNPPLIQGPNDKSLKGIPPKPVLSIRKTNTGIILQWRMPYDLGLYEGIASYQLYAYQETSSAPSTDMWRKVGDVKAMALPMACTLTQFADKNKYYFAVRPVDIHKRIGRFSNPEEISL